MKLRGLVQLKESRLIGRDLKVLEKAVQKYIRGAKITNLEEFTKNRFQKNIEGEGTYPSNLKLDGDKGRKVADKLEKALEKIAFAEFNRSGQTVMGVDASVGGGSFDFIIEFDQD